MLEAGVLRLQDTFAPDKRTDRVVARLSGDTLLGYTTVPAAFDSIAALLQSFPGKVNQVRLLPDDVVGERTCGIVNVAVANLRSAPGHSQELATQALLGTPVQLLDFADGWYLVRTPDRYLAWLEPGALEAMTPAEARTWMTADLRLYVGGSGEIRSAPGKGRIVSTLVPGGLVEYFPGAEDENHERVRLPDGALGWVSKGVLASPEDYFTFGALSPVALLTNARRLAGRPYLWGGTSPTAMDCSGFTKMAYYLNGFVVPRDASQQVHAGVEVELTADFANLRPGDQLFFGSYRADGSEKITHTGFYLGEGRFLHAGADNGRIMENSLLPQDANFAEHRRKSLLRVRRLGAGGKGVVPVWEAFGALLKG